MLTGKGVKIIVIDDGLDINHPDLYDNTRNSTLNCDLVGSFSGICIDSDPTPTDPDDSHGTMVGGIISAVGFNGIGVNSVAPGAQIGGHNFLRSQSTTNRIKALSAEADIFNQSYGSTITSPWTWLSSSIYDAFKAGTETGRNGKGKIYVKSAGNSFYSNGASSDCTNAISNQVSCGNTAFDSSHQVPYQILVAALNYDDQKSSYSTAGSANWVSAFGGDNHTIFTTHPSGIQSGTNDDLIDETGNYTFLMNGTSSAAPMISGAVALMLQTNPNLTWRDVKYILAKTAVKIDANIQAKDHTNSNGEVINIRQPWVINAAGFNFHNWYGFGKINISAAVELSDPVKLSESLGSNLSSLGSTLSSQTYTINPNSTIAPQTTGEFTLNLDINKRIETIKVTIYSSNHTATSNSGLGDLHFTATSPSTTKSTLLNLFTGIQASRNSGFLEMHLLSNAFYREYSGGSWRVSVYNNHTTRSVNINKVEVKVYYGNEE